MTEMADPPTDVDDPHNARLKAAGEQETAAWLSALGAEYRVHLEQQTQYLVRQVAYLQDRCVGLAAEVARRDERIMELEGEMATEGPADDPENDNPWG